MTDFTDDQMTAINNMIAQKVTEATAAQKTEIAGLNRTITTLNSEKTSATTAAETAEAERIATSGTLEDFKNLATTLQGKLEASNAKVKEVMFDNAITAAVGAANIRSEMRDDMVDLLKHRARYNDAEGVTSVNGQSPADYLTDLLASDRGKIWMPSSGSSGGGATSVKDTSGPSAMTKDNFSMDRFLTFPKMERDVMAGNLGFDAEKVAVLKAIP